MKQNLITFGIALLAVYVANNVAMVRNIVGPKA